MGIFDTIVDKVRSVTNTNGNGFKSTISNVNSFGYLFKSVKVASNPLLQNSPKYAVKSLMNKYGWCAFGGNYLANDGIGGAMNMFQNKNYVGMHSNIDTYKSPSAKNIIEWSNWIHANDKVTKEPVDVPDAEGEAGKSSLVKDKNNNWVDDKNIQYKSSYHNTAEGTNSASFTAKNNVRHVDNVSRKSLPPTMGNLRYEWKDFAYCSNYGKIPNNRLITLRRFKAPCLDSGAIAGKDKMLQAMLPDNAKFETDEEFLTSDSARALTYFGDGVNTLDSLTSFTWGFNWKEMSADMGNPDINSSSMFTSSNNPFVGLDVRKFGNPLKLLNGDGVSMDNLKSGSSKDEMINSVLGVWMLYSQYESAKKSGNVPGITEDSTIKDFVVAISPESDPYKHGYSYRIYGDINVINQTYARTRGFSWGGDTITLKFNYDMSQVDTYNSKMVMLDIISNMLALTYNDANFYGGDYRFMRTPTEFPLPPAIQDIILKMSSGETDMDFEKAFSDLRQAINYAPYKQAITGIGNSFEGIMKTAGTLMADADTIYTDVVKELTEQENQKKQNEPKSGESKSPPEEIKLSQDKESSIMYNLFKKLYNTTTGLGDNFRDNKNYAFAYAFKDLRSFDGIQKNIVSLKPLITGEPIGEWHLTIGNPMNPIMMIGNLICVNSSMKFGSTLGPDDFPTSIEFTVTLRHARQRDKGDIESMINNGQGRFYVKVDGVPEPWNIGFSTKNTANDTGTGNESHEELEDQNVEDLTSSKKGYKSGTEPKNDWSITPDPYNSGGGNDYADNPGYIKNKSNSMKTNFKQGNQDLGGTGISKVYFS